MYGTGRSAGPLSVARLMRWATILTGLMLVVLHASAAPTLTIGRTDAQSLLTDISEQVLREAFRRAGWGIEFRKLPLPRAIETANDGDIDADIQRIAEVARRYPNLIMVPTPINRVDVAIYGDTPAVAALTRAEIAGLRVGIARGTFVLAKHSAGLMVTDAQTLESVTQMLHAGRVDVTMAVYIDTELTLADGRTRDLHRWPHLWASEPLYFMLHKRHADLVAPLNAVLQQMQQEGLIDKAYSDGLRRLKLAPLTPDAAASGTGPGRR